MDRWIKHSRWGLKSGTEALAGCPFLLQSSLLLVVFTARMYQSAVPIFFTPVVSKYLVIFNVSTLNTYYSILLFRDIRKTSGIS